VRINFGHLVAQQFDGDRVKVRQHVVLAGFLCFIINST
jgi:hypothetical protein